MISSYLRIEYNKVKQAPPEIDSWLNENKRNVLTRGVGQFDPSKGLAIVRRRQKIYKCFFFELEIVYRCPLVWGVRNAVFF